MAKMSSPCRCDISREYARTYMYVCIYVCSHVYAMLLAIPFVMNMDQIEHISCHVQAIGFGNPSEKFTVLRSMAKALKHGSFSANGLDPKHLLATFTTLASTLTELSSTLTCSGEKKIVRTDVQKVSDTDLDVDQIMWDVYPKYCYFDTYFEKIFSYIFQWSHEQAKFQKLPSTDRRVDINGVLHSKQYFWSGAERLVFKFAELKTADAGLSISIDRTKQMVAKQSNKQIPGEDMFSLEFHEPFCRTQSNASLWANKFNHAMSEHLVHLRSLQSASRIRYLKPLVYRLWDTESYGGRCDVLVEEFLPGKYTKWNNNAGKVKRQVKLPTSSTTDLADGGSGANRSRVLVGVSAETSAATSAVFPHLRSTSRTADLANRWGALPEESDEEDSSNDSDDLLAIWSSSSRDENDNVGFASASSTHETSPAPSGDSKRQALRGLTVEDIEFLVPQCFSHFTYERSGYEELVCDIQGTWNRVDGFALTDPVIHHRFACTREGEKNNYGDTDRGLKGIHKFMETHKCNALCRVLGLPRCK